MAWGAAIAAAGSIAGQFLGQANSSKAMKAQFDYQRALQREAADLNYNYTRRLNKTAYQDTTQSMREAGINPMLAINQGINNLSSNVSTGQAQMAVAPNELDLASAVELSQKDKQVKNDSARVKNETVQTTSNIHKNNVESELLNKQKEAQEINNSFAAEKNLKELELLDAQKQNQINQGNSALIVANNNTAMTNSNIANNASMTKSNVQLNSAKTTEANANAHSHPYKDLYENVIQPMSNSARSYYNNNIRGQGFRGSYNNVIRSIINSSKGSK